MDLCLVILSIHEYIQQALGCFEAEYLAHNTLGVVNLQVVLIVADFVRLIESVDYFGDGHADVPEHFRSALTLIVQFSDYHIDYLLYLSFHEVLLKFYF